jgi:hypothetical protein
LAQRPVHPLSIEALATVASTDRRFLATRPVETEGDGVPCILEADRSSKEYRKNWARLIQKIYEVDPLACPRCQGQMRVIAFIEKQEVIKKILKRLILWDVKPRPQP